MGRGWLRREEEGGKGDRGVEKMPRIGHWKEGKDDVWI